MAKKVRKQRVATSVTARSSVNSSRVGGEHRPTYSSKGKVNYAQFAYSEAEVAILRNAAAKQSSPDAHDQEQMECDSPMRKASSGATRHFDVQAVQRELRAHRELERGLNQLQHGRMDGATHASWLKQVATSHGSFALDSLETKLAPSQAQGQTWEFADASANEVARNAAWQAYQAQQEELEQATRAQAFADYEARQKDKEADSSFATLFAASAASLEPKQAEISSKRPSPAKKIKGYVFNKKHDAQAESTDSELHSLTKTTAQEAVEDYAQNSQTGSQQESQAGEDFATLFGNNSLQVVVKDSEPSSSSKTKNASKSQVNNSQQMRANQHDSNHSTESMTDFERYLATGKFDPEPQARDYLARGKEAFESTSRSHSMSTFTTQTAKKSKSLGSDNLRTLAQAERELRGKQETNESFASLYGVFDSYGEHSQAAQLSDGRGFAKVSTRELKSEQHPSGPRKKRKFLTTTPSGTSKNKALGTTPASNQVDWFNQEQVERFSSRNHKSSDYAYRVNSSTPTNQASEHEGELSFAELFEGQRTATGKKVYVANKDGGYSTPSPSQAKVSEQVATPSKALAHTSATSSGVDASLASSKSSAQSRKQRNATELSEFALAWQQQTSQTQATPSNSVASRLAQEARQAQHQQRQELGLMSRKQQLELELAREASLVKLQEGAQFISDINMRFDESNYMRANFFAQGYPAYIFEHLKQGNFNVDLEIDLHGCSRDDVKVIINKAIVSALNHHESILYFMTGHGRDILKQALPNYLIQHSQICAFVPRVDGTGQTNGFIVLLKNFSKEFFNH